MDFRISLFSQIADFSKDAGEYGFVGACLVSLALFVAAGVVWFAYNVVKPLVASHISTVTSLASTAVEQAKTLERIAETQELQAKICGDHGEHLKVIRSGMEAMKK